MWQLSECIDGMAEACRALVAAGHRGQRQPLQRERRCRHRPDARSSACSGWSNAVARPAPGTGLVRGRHAGPARHRVRRPTGRFPLEGTRWATERRGHRDGHAARPRPRRPRRGVRRWWPLLVGRRSSPVAHAAPLVHAVHDVSGGGLAVALAEMAAAAGTGCAVDAVDVIRPSSSPSCPPASWWPRRTPTAGVPRARPRPGVAGRVLGPGRRRPRHALGDAGRSAASAPLREAHDGESGPACWANRERRGPVRQWTCGGWREGSLRCLRGLRARTAGWPTSPSTASSPCSTGARSRPAWRSATATPSPWSRTWAWWPPSSTSAPSRGSRPPGHRPHPLLDPRLLGLGGRPAGLPTGGAGRLRARPQRQPDQHHRAGREGRHAARAPSPPTATSWPSCWPSRFPESRGPGRRAAGRAAAPRGCVLLRPDELRAPLRRARPVRVPAAVPRPPRAGGGARGLGAGLRDARASSVIGATLRARDRPGRARGDRRRRGPPASRSPGCASPSSRLCIFEFAYIARPDSRLYGREVHATALPHGRAAGRAGAGRGRHGHGRARVGCPRGGGVRPGQRHPLRAGPGQEPLHRPHLHRPRPAGARPTRCAASSTR